MIKKKVSSNSKMLGNDFWNRRATHGREKLFSSPELLWEAASEYFQYVLDNPWHKVEAKVVDKSVELVEMPTVMPFTLNGLCLFIGCDPSYFRTFKSVNKGKHKDFLAVISAIERTIQDQQFNGASAGYFKENIISRMLGLSDKAESVNTNVNITPSSDEAKAIRKAMEKKI